MRYAFPSLLSCLIHGTHLSSTYDYTDVPVSSNCYVYIYIYIEYIIHTIIIRRPLLVRGQQAVGTLRGGEPSISSLTGGYLHFAFLARAARMLQTASGDDPKIAQNSNTSKIASGRPRIAPRRLQDGQDAQTDPNRTPETTPNKSPDPRNIKANCDMKIVQKH